MEDFFGKYIFKTLFSWKRFNIINIITLLAISADDKFVIFFLFSQKTGFDISCKLSLLETICMKYQNLFSVENKKNISSAENFTQGAKRKGLWY